MKIEKDRLYTAIDGRSGDPFVVKVLVPKVEYRLSTRDMKGSQPLYVVTQLQRKVGMAFYDDTLELPSSWDLEYFEQNFKELNGTQSRTLQATQI